MSAIQRIAGITLGLLLAAYFIAAFILADWAFLAGLFTTWNKGDRATMVYFVICGVAGGWFIGARPR